MNSISTALSHVTLGLEVTVKSLSMFPLLADAPGEGADPAAPGNRFEPLTLDEALSSGWARITETSEAGSVPELRFVNSGSRPIFILDGEELLGAKQNRIVNLSLLVPAMSTLTIPVSCVEAGRWHARSRSFAAAPRIQYGAARAKRNQQVTASLLSTGARRADQSAVWADISEKSARLCSMSDTGAMEAMFVSHAETLDEFVDAMVPFPGQVGALFTVSDRIAGFDLFRSDALLRKLLPKIVRSHALDAIDPAAYAADRPGVRRRPSQGHGPSRRAGAEHFVRRCARAHAKTVPAIGLGEDVRLEAPGLSGAALVHDTAVVHLSAFAV
jgi:hypothetical protein